MDFLLKVLHQGIHRLWVVRLGKELITSEFRETCESIGMSATIKATC